MSSANVVAHSFTNHAGHAVSGRLTAITNGMAVISGRAFPLSAFPEQEQTRMRALLGAHVGLPLKLMAKRRSLRDRLLRVNALEKAGAKTPEAASERREKILRDWRRTLETADLDAATKAYWLDHFEDVPLFGPN